MSATPRSARLSTPAQVVAILGASVVVWVGIIAAVILLFINVFIPAVTLGGKGEIPGDFPVYPGAHLETAIASSFDACTTVSATWTASSRVDDVVSFYRSALASGDWSITDSGEHRGAFELYFESISGPHREGVVTLSSQPYGDSTVINLELDKSRGAPAAGCKVLVGTSR